METFLKFEQFLQANPTMMGIYFFILGLCLASFLNVVIFRTPKIMAKEEADIVKEWLEEKGEKFPEKLEPLRNKISLSFPASHCYACNTPLKWYHNIPVLSYLFLRGKCGHCSAKISMQYPIVEIIGGFLLYFSYTTFISAGLAPFLVMSTFFFICYALFGIDWKSYLLPDHLTLPLMWIGLGAAALGYGFKDVSLQNAFYGAAGAYLICLFIGWLGRLVFKKEALGEGDYKLLAAVGAFLGLGGAIFTFVGGAFVGIIIYIIRRVIMGKEDYTPFGPSLIIASFIWIFFYQSVIEFFPMFK